jgi:uncharacterized membrane protein (DUF441 family)
MKRLLFVALVPMAWLLLIGATGGSQSTAIAIATVVALVLPFALKYIPAAGHYMVAITLGASLVVAVLAEVATGEIVLSNLQATNATALLAMFLSVYGLSQVVYSLLAQSSKTAATVT